MNVNFIRNISIMIGSILTLAAMGLFSCPVFAQERVEGRFKLVQEVHWGSSVLPAGDYLYSVDTGKSPALVQVYQKNGSFSSAFVPRALVTGAYSGPSGVVIEQIQGQPVVTSLRVQGLNLQLDFPVKRVKEKIDMSDGNHAFRTIAADPLVLGYFTILNPSHERVSIEDAEKVYLSACEAVEREFNRSDAVRPRLTLVLGANNDVLRYETREILLKKWDEYMFAEAVVGLAMNDLTSREERMKLSELAVSQAEATVDLCQLKNCKSKN